MTTAIIMSLCFLAPMGAVHADSHGDCTCKSGDCFPFRILVIGSGRANDTLPTAYVDNRNYVQGNGLWIYEESNHVDGLQRGGSGLLIPTDAEICTDDSLNGPDQLVF